MDFSKIPEGTCRDLAEGDIEFRSWVEKLRLVAGIIGLRVRGDPGATVAPDDGETPLDMDSLAAFGVYLRWVGTCVVRCHEDDGNQPLDSAAAVARGIFVSLETAAGEIYTPGLSENGETERERWRD